jgi:hypothetical protein
VLPYPATTGQRLSGLNFSSWIETTENIVVTPRSFKAMLCDLIDITAARVDVNICHKDCTVWGHFVNNLPRRMTRRTKVRILRTIQTFLKYGADPYFDYTNALIEYDPKSEQRGEQPIGSKL